MTQIIPCGSGKGGVGKSLTLANLALSLSQKGRTVILLDLDLGAANLHTFLGIKNNQNGIGNLLHKQHSGLESLIRSTPYDKLYFIPGDNLLPETANHPYYMKKRILKEISKLTADYVFMDLGAGTSFNTLDYLSLKPQPFILVTPEPTSLLNAYSLIKNSLFRMLLRDLKRKSPERILLKELLLKRMEGKDWNMFHIRNRFIEDFPHLSVIFENIQERYYPHIIINMGRNREDLALTRPLRKMCRKNLGLEIRYFGFLHYEENMHLSVKGRHPFILDYPKNPYTQDIERLAEALEDRRGFSNIEKLDFSDDLSALI